MKAKIACISITMILLFGNAAVSQKTNHNEISLSPWPVEQIANFAVWRTDYYICTGIAYAKSRGLTVDDFAEFVGTHHSLENVDTKHVEQPVRILYHLINNYPNGKFEIISESDSSATVRFNRPYAEYFKNGPQLGVSLEEFEKFLYGHITILLERKDIDFKYHIHGEEITAMLIIGG